MSTNTNVQSIADSSGNNAAIFGGIFFDFDVNMEKMKFGKELDYNLKNLKDTIVGRSISNRSWNYLPGSLMEVNNINDILVNSGWNSKQYTGYNGSEECFKKLNGNNSPRIVHLSTHGFFLKDIEQFSEKNENQKTENPLLRSGLIMSGANRAWTGKPVPEGIEDGILSSYEIANTWLGNTELVVLSACETGLGDIKSGEGVYGLQRAFQLAGVKSVIMSLWQVPDDETMELMTNFYSEWLKTGNKFESFHKAQSVMAAKYKPFYWAAFVMLE